MYKLTRDNSLVWEWRDQPGISWESLYKCRQLRSSLTLPWIWPLRRKSRQEELFQRLKTFRFLHFFMNELLAYLYRMNISCGTTVPRWVSLYHQLCSTAQLFQKYLDWGKVSRMQGKFYWQHRTPSSSCCQSSPLVREDRKDSDSFLLFL